MAKPTKKSRYSQRAITSGKIKKLQRAGLLSDRINPDTKPSKYVVNQLFKYRGVLSGRQAAVTVSSARKASELRTKVGEGGVRNIVIVPRQKGERFRVTKDDKIKSTRKAYGQTIDKIIGETFTAPKPGEKLYYTIPKRVRGTRHFKRRTFASYDELLFYLSSESGSGMDEKDIRQYLEIERFREGSRRERQFKREYNEAVRKLKNKRKRKPKRRGRK
jgi:hypothetical protein